MSFKAEKTSVIQLQEKGILLVEDGNHGEYRPLKHEFCDVGTSFIRAADLRDGGVDFCSAEKINTDATLRIRKGIGKTGDVLISHKGTLGKIGFVKEGAPPFVCSPQTTFWRVMNDEVIDRHYLFAYMRSPQFMRVFSVCGGETDMAPYVSLASQRSIELCLPQIGIQRAVGNIIRSFDDKIELNRKTNKTLEATAEALFKSWFVDFDPVRAKAEGRPTGLPAEISDLLPDSFEDSALGEIPSGWSVGEINQIFNLQKDSLDPASASEEIFDHYSIPAFDAGKFPAKELGSSIRSQKFLVGDGDLLASKLNPSTPRVWIPFASSGRRAMCLTEFLVCRTSSDFGRAYAYCLASSDAIVEAMTSLAGGTSNSHQRIRPGDFLSLPCCIGTEMLRSAFLGVVEPLLGKSLLLRTEGRSLSTIRDALLPKLISGEIRIPDAEKMLEEVGV